MDTEVYNGKSSPNEALAGLAELLDVTVISMLVAALVGIFTLMALASWRYRRALTFRALLPALAALPLASLLFVDLTVRGENYLAYVALACLAAAIGLGGQGIRLAAITVNWNPTKETRHAPALAGANILAASITLTLGFTLLQNAMSAHFATGVAILHNGIALSVGAALTFLVAQIFYRRKLKAQQPNLFVNLKKRLEAEDKPTKKQEKPTAA